MALPKIDLPIYELTIPSTGKEIRVRPFIVKEEKLLMMAAESKDSNEIISATKQIINNCLIDGDVNVDTLPFFDIDYLFIALRAKSIGEKIDMRFTCNSYGDDGQPCRHVFEEDIDISKCRIIKNDEISTEINLGDTIVKMKYPSYSIMKAINDNDTILDKKIKIIVNSIDMMVKGQNVYTSKDFTKEELTEFVEGLTEQYYKKLEVFVDNFPYFVVDVNHTCERCGFHHVIEYKDFESFFQ